MGLTSPAPPPPDPPAQPPASLVHRQPGLHRADSRPGSRGVMVPSARPGSGHHASLHFDLDSHSWAGIRKPCLPAGSHRSVFRHPGAAERETHLRGRRPQGFQATPSYRPGAWGPRQRPGAPTCPFVALCPWTWPWPFAFAFLPGAGKACLPAAQTTPVFRKSRIISWSKPPRCNI